MTVTLPQVLNGILSTAASALTEAGNPAGRVSLTPGGLAVWDECCEGSGQLWLRVTEVYPTSGRSNPFPDFDTAQPHGCGVNALAVSLGLGTVRCAHTVNDDGSAPAPDEVTSDALVMLADLNTLLNVIVCEVSSVPGVSNVQLGRWSPQGPDGGCAGGEWAFTIAYVPCLCAAASS